VIASALLDPATRHQRERQRAAGLSAGRGFESVTGIGQIAPANCRQTSLAFRDGGNLPITEWSRSIFWTAIGSSLTS